MAGPWEELEGNPGRMVAVARGGLGPLVKRLRGVTAVMVRSEEGSPGLGSGGPGGADSVRKPGEEDSRWTQARHSGAHGGHR